jgi:RimJ/RimL family protein N-acetyltransferase
MISGLREIVRRRGVRGTLRRAQERLSPMTGWHDEFVFYALDVTDARRPRPPLADGLALRRGTREDVPVLAQLPADLQVTSMTPEIVRARLQSDALLWLVMDGPRLAFSCWNFLGQGPLIGAQGGDRPIPPDVVMLEDSISSPHVRGRGVAPAARAAIADYHAREGRGSMVTKVAVENVAVQRALEKAGFGAVAHMHRSGPIWRMRVEMSILDSGALAYWLTTLAS